MVTVGDYEFPEDRYYSSDHLWIKLTGENVVEIGIDKMGFSIAGKISMIRIKKAGKPLKKGRAFGTMESGKGVVPLKAPVNGEIMEVNSLVLEKKFDELMEKNYECWLIKARIDDASELDELMKDTSKIVPWAKDELAKLK
ncbi:MAG: glycine cleavage system protein H [Promethearchaeota archaeon]